MLIIGIILGVVVYFVINYLTRCEDEMDELDKVPSLPQVDDEVIITPEVVIPKEPTFKDYLDTIKIRLYIPAVYVDESTEIQYMLQQVKVNIPEISKVESLKIHIYYLDRERNRLADSFNNEKTYSELECGRGNCEYRIMEFSNTNCVLSEYKVVSITLEDGTILLPDPEPENWW